MLPCAEAATVAIDRLTRACEITNLRLGKISPFDPIHSRRCSKPLTHVNPLGRRGCQPLIHPVPITRP